MKRRPPVGDVVQIQLPSGKYAYGRILKDAQVAFYAATTDQPAQPPIGDRDFVFTVGVYDDVVRSRDTPVVGHDPSLTEEEDWPPPACVKDPLTGTYQIYHKGILRDSSEQECVGLEPAAAWDRHHIVNRLMNR